MSERKEDITHIRVSVEQKEMLQKIKEIEGLRSLRKGLQKLIQDSDYTNKFKRIDRSFNRMLEEVPEGKKEKKKDKFELIRSLTKQVIRIDDPEKYREKTGYIPESYKKLFLEEKKEDTEPQTKEGENLMKANPKEKREEDRDIKIEKGWVIKKGEGSLFGEGRLVERKPEYWISERIAKGLRGKPIRLFEEDITDLEEKAEEEDKDLVDEIIKIVDLKKSSKEKFEEFIHTIISKPKKKLDDYSQGGIK